MGCKSPRELCLSARPGELADQQLGLEPGPFGSYQGPAEQAKDKGGDREGAAHHLPKYRRGGEGLLRTGHKAERSGLQKPRAGPRTSFLSRPREEEEEDG